MLLSTSIVILDCDILITILHVAITYPLSAADEVRDRCPFCCWGLDSIFIALTMESFSCGSIPP